MGYELHIIRQNDWYRYDEVSNITIEEWINYVSSDSELELKNGYMDMIHNTWIKSLGYCEWTTYFDENNNTNPWFLFSSGRISTKYPDDNTIIKMIRIAEVLNARVQGDDGEFYDNSYLEKTLFKNIQKENKPWWKFW